MCARLANDMYDAIDVFAQMARTVGFDLRRLRFEMRSWALTGLRQHGVKLTDEAIDAILGKDFELNAAGLAAWLKREGG